MAVCSPFWDATAHRWVRVAALKYGTHLRTPTAGGTVTVLGGYTPRDRYGWMWDLTVPGDHDFYVVTTVAGILVHNQGCGDAEPTSDELRAEARDVWQQETGRRAIWDNLVVHHEMPLEWRHVYSGEINDIGNLVGMINKDHQAISQAWRVWKVGLQGRTPAEGELLAQRDSLGRMYAPLMVFP